MRGVAGLLAGGLTNFQIMVDDPGLIVLLDVILGPFAPKDAQFLVLEQYFHPA